MCLLNEYLKNNIIKLSCYINLCNSNLLGLLFYQFMGGSHYMQNWSFQ